MPTAAPARRAATIQGRYIVWALVAWTVVAASAIALGAGSIDLAVYLRAASDLVAGRDPNATPPGQLPWLYPPFAAAVYVPLLVLPFPVAAVVVALGSVAALARTLHLVLARLGRPELTLIATAAAIATEPVYATLGYGQVNLVLAWLITEGFLGRHRWLIGVAAGIKLTPLVFLLPLLVRRRERAATSAVTVFDAGSESRSGGGDGGTMPTSGRAVGARAGARRAWPSLRACGEVLGALLGTAAVGWVVAPAASAAYWSGLFLEASDRIGIAYATNQSLSGALWRAAGEGGVPVLTAVLSVAVVLVTAALLRRPDTDDMLALCVTGMAGLLISPISWIHHWVWILPLALWLLAHGRRPLALAWGILLVGRVTWWYPSGGHVEAAHDLLGKLTQDSWTILAMVTLGVLAMARARVPDGGSRPDVQGGDAHSATARAAAGAGFIERAGMGRDEAVR